MRLEGKTVLVSGAGPGMGRGTALLCAQEGATVIIVARRAEHLEETLGVIKRLGTPAAEAAQAITGDVSDGPDSERIVLAARDAGGGHLDVLYSGGGGFFDPSVTLSEVEPSFWRQAIGNTMEGPSNLARAVQPVMKQQGGGSIIFITASESVQRGLQCRLWRGEGRRHRAGAQSCEGAVAGQHPRERRRSRPDPYPTWRRRGRHTHAGVELQRRGHVSDVAHAALYFATDESAWVTGQVLSVDGGVDAGGRGLWDLER